MSKQFGLVRFGFVFGLVYIGVCLSMLVEHAALPRLRDSLWQSTSISGTNPENTLATCQ